MARVAVTRAPTKKWHVANQDLTSGRIVPGLAMSRLRLTTVGTLDLMESVNIADDVVAAIGAGVLPCADRASVAHCATITPL